MSKSRSSDHIDDMVEWGQKQYTPWEYAQEGKLPPVFKAKGNKKRAAIFFFIQGIVCAIVVVLLLLKNSDGEWQQLLIPAVYAVLCFLASANYLKQWKAVKLKKEKERARRKKKKAR